MRKRIFVFAIMLCIAIVSVQSADFRNFYGISWRGTACDNIDYAKSMGYDFVNYQPGMEKCPNNKDIGFFFETPETKVYPYNRVKIDTAVSYPLPEIDALNDFLLWKSNSPFPLNIATGWFDSSTKFQTLPDFQRQEIIDKVVNDVMARIPKMENKTNNFYFAGFSWDVPSIEGDLWSGLKSAGGKHVTIKYWTGTDSGVKHPGKTYKYSSYKDGLAAYRKQLVAKAKEKYPGTKIIIEPYMPYEYYIAEIEKRDDKDKLKPDMICQEGAETYKFNLTLNFVNDKRIFDSGLITKKNMCSSTPKVYDHESNMKILGAAGINNAWFTWFGRFGGTGNMPNYKSIREVPARLKLIRAMAGWDNLNGATSRTWDANILRYKSTHSYADRYVMYSRHPKSKMIYAVVLDKDKSYIKLRQNETVAAIYRTDSLFRKTTRADSDFKKAVINGYPTVDLIDSSNHHKGYIIEVR